MMGKSKNSAHTDDSKTKISTIIGENTVFDGDIKSPDAIRIDGILNGNCTCQRQLIIGPTGQLTGNISAESTIISGKVNGDVSVRGKMELMSTGKLTGNITARSLVIDEDAFFDGKCTMTASANNSDAAKKPAETPKNTASDAKDKK